MAQDMELLHKGLIYPLANDDHGRAVFFWDRTRYTRKVASCEAILRCHFYCYHTLKERQGKPCREVVFLTNFRVRKHHVKLVDSRFLCSHLVESRFLKPGIRCLQAHGPYPFQKVLQISLAIPVRIKSVHLCSGPGVSAASIVLPVLRFIFGHHYSQRTQTHSGSGPELALSLEEYGLRHQNHALPLYRGAFYNQEQCAIFLKEMQEMEQQSATESSRVG